MEESGRKKEAEEETIDDGFVEGENSLDALDKADKSNERKALAYEGAEGGSTPCRDQSPVEEEGCEDLPCFYEGNYEVTEGVEECDYYHMFESDAEEDSETKDPLHKNLKDDNLSWGSSDEESDPKAKQKNIFECFNLELGKKVAAEGLSTLDCALDKNVLASSVCGALQTLQAGKKFDEFTVKSSCADIGKQGSLASKHENGRSHTIKKSELLNRTSEENEALKVLYEMRRRQLYVVLTRCDDIVPPPICSSEAPVMEDLAVKYPCSQSTDAPAVSASIPLDISKNRCEATFKKLVKQSRLKKGRDVSTGAAISTTSKSRVGDSLPSLPKPQTQSKPKTRSILQKAGRKRRVQKPKPKSPLKSLITVRVDHNVAKSRTDLGGEKLEDDKKQMPSKAPKKRAERKAAKLRAKNLSLPPVKADQEANILSDPIRRKKCSEFGKISSKAHIVPEPVLYYEEEEIIITDSQISLSRRKKRRKHKAFTHVKKRTAAFVRPASPNTPCPENPAPLSPVTPAVSIKVEQNEEDIDTARPGRSLRASFDSISEDFLDIDDNSSVDSESELSQQIKDICMSLDCSAFEPSDEKQFSLRNCLAALGATEETTDPDTSSKPTKKPCKRILPSRKLKYNSANVITKSTKAKSSRKLAFKSAKARKAVQRTSKLKTTSSPVLPALPDCQSIFPNLAKALNIQPSVPQETEPAVTDDNKHEKGVTHMNEGDSDEDVSLADLKHAMEIEDKSIAVKTTKPHYLQALKRKRKRVFTRIKKRKQPQMHTTAQDPSFDCVDSAPQCCKEENHETLAEVSFDSEKASDISEVTAKRKPISVQNMFEAVSGLLKESDNNVSAPKKRKTRQRNSQRAKMQLSTVSSPKQCKPETSDSEPLTAEADKMEETETSGPPLSPISACAMEPSDVDLDGHTDHSLAAIAEQTPPQPAPPFRNTPSPLPPVTSPVTHTASPPPHLPKPSSPMSPFAHPSHCSPVDQSPEDLESERDVLETEAMSYKRKSSRLLDSLPKKAKTETCDSSDPFALLDFPSDLTAPIQDRPTDRQKPQIWNPLRLDGASKAHEENPLNSMIKELFTELSHVEHFKRGHETAPERTEPVSGIKMDKNPSNIEPELNSLPEPHIQNRPIDHFADIQSLAAGCSVDAHSLNKNFNTPNEGFVDTLEDWLTSMSDQNMEQQNMRALPHCPKLIPNLLPERQPMPMYPPMPQNSNFMDFDQVLQEKERDCHRPFPVSCFDSRLEQRMTCYPNHNSVYDEPHPRINFHRPPDPPYLDTSIRENAMKPLKKRFYGEQQPSMRKFQEMETNELPDNFHIQSHVASSYEEYPPPPPVDIDTTLRWRPLL